MTYTMTHDEAKAQQLVARYHAAGFSAYYLTLRSDLYEVRSWVRL